MGNRLSIELIRGDDGFTRMILNPHTSQEFQYAIANEDFADFAKQMTEFSQTAEGYSIASYSLSETTPIETASPSEDEIE